LAQQRHGFREEFADGSARDPASAIFWPAPTWLFIVIGRIRREIRRLNGNIN
jgi:hypothetical protein